MTSQDRLNIAVFIDFDNIEIGVKNTLGQQFDVGSILDAIKERGEVVTKIAYADWTRAGEYSRALTQHAIRLVQRNLTPGGDKNGADINLALDALEMAFTHPHINAYVIVGGDSDFLSLVEKLKQYDKKVFVVGGRGFTSTILQRNCHEFIAYENLGGVRRGGFKGGRPISPPASIPITQAFPIVRRALKILADREVSPQTGLLKSTLLQLDSTFSERNYGASSFFDFVEKLSQAGLVSLKHAGRSLMVELNEGFAAPEGAAPENGTVTTPVAAESGVPSTESAAVLPTESAEAGVERAGRILGAATNARWPMYLRNVRQILRQAEGGFDERRYGFGGLMDLLKACQRAGLVRIERDHRGGLRVFYGPSLRVAGQSRGSAVPTPEPVAAPRNESMPDESMPEEQMEDSRGNMAVAAAAPAPVTADDSLEAEESGPETIPIDTTANRLGLTNHRRTRTWASRQPAPAPAPATPTRPAATKSAPRKKPAARKSARSKKASQSAD